MPRRIEKLLTACRATRQAVTIWVWQTGVYVKRAAWRFRWTASITRWWAALLLWSAGGAGRNGRKPGTNTTEKSGRTHSARSRRRGWIFGLRKFGPAARTFRIRRKLSSESSNTSGESADSPQCLSNSITMPRRDRRHAAGCLKPSAGWSVRTSTRGALRSPSRSGLTKTWTPNCKPDSHTR